MAIRLFTTSMVSQFCSFNIFITNPTPRFDKHVAYGWICYQNKKSNAEIMVSHSVKCLIIKCYLNAVSYSRFGEEIIYMQLSAVIGSQTNLLILEMISSYGSIFAAVFRCFTTVGTNTASDIGIVVGQETSFVFAVMTANDAHVYFSSVPGNFKTFWGIFIGGNTNTQTLLVWFDNSVLSLSLSQPLTN